MGKSLVVGDLHVGNIYASVLDFLLLMKSVKDDGIVPDRIIFDGDFLDGLDKYSTQTYKQFPETIDVQRKLLSLIISVITNEFPRTKLVFVYGNHEMDFRGTLIDGKILEKVYNNVEFVREYIDDNDFLYVHMIGRSSRIGSLSGWTPSTVSRALSLISYKEQQLGKSIRGIVVAHVHKVFDIITISGKTLILLPAFLKTGYETSEDSMYTPTIVLIEGNNFKLYSKNFERDDIIKRFNHGLVYIVNNFDYTDYTIDDLLAILEFEPRKIREIIQKRFVPVDNKESDSAGMVEFEYGKRKYKITKDLYDKIVELLTKGLSPREACRRVGINKNVCYGILKKIKA